jgi:hypothetical protein
LEEGGASWWLGRGAGLDRWELRGQGVEEAEEEDRDEEKDYGGGVMIGRLRKQKKYESEDRSEECESFPSADFWSADHH